MRHVNGYLHARTYFIGNDLKYFIRCLVCNITQFIVYIIPYYTLYRIIIVYYTVQISAINSQLLYYFAMTWYFQQSGSLRAHLP